jgi:hypothetical protein
MAVALVAYIVVHSPAQRLLQEIIGATIPGCPGVCDFEGLWQVARAAMAIWLIATAALGAWAVVERTSFATFERPVTWAVIAFALITIPAAFIGGLSDVASLPLLKAPLGYVLASVPSVVAIAWVMRSGWRPKRPRFSVPPLPPIVLLVSSLVIVLTILSLGIAVRRPPTGSDELGYHAPLAVMLWREGNLGGFLAGLDDSWPMWHPASGELWVGLLLEIGGEPLAILGQLPFAWLGAGAAALFALRLRLPRPLAWLAGLLFLLSPMVVVQSSRMSSDVIAAGLVIAAGALAAAPVHSWSTDRVVLVALTLGVLAVTKLAALPLVVAIGGFMAWSTWRAHRRDTTSAIASADGSPPAGGSRGARFVQASAIGIVLFLAAVGPWWARNVIAHGNPIYPAALPIIGRGIAQQRLRPMDPIHVPDPRLWPLYPLIDAHDNNSGLGAAFAVGIVPGLVGAAFLARRRPLALLATAAAVAIPAWWLFSRHEPRFLLGLAGLAFALIPFTLIVVGRRWRATATAILALASVLSAGLTVSTALSQEASEPVARDEFYTTVWDLNPAALVLPESEGLLLDDDCPGGLKDLYPLLGPAQGRRVVRIPCEATPDDIVATLRRNGMSYAYITGFGADAGDWALRYPPSNFELVSRTVPSRPRAADREAHLYRLLEPSPARG